MADFIDLIEIISHFLLNTGIASEPLPCDFFTDIQKTDKEGCGDKTAVRG